MECAENSTRESVPAKTDHEYSQERSRFGVICRRTELPRVFRRRQVSSCAEARNLPERE